MRLPEGLSARPLTLEDASAVTEIMAASELADTGEVFIEEADISSEWQRPSYDIARSTIGVFAGERLVGYADYSGHDRGDAAVHPDHRGRGIGTELAGWMQDTARAQGATIVGMPVPLGSPGERLLQRLAYQERWHTWIFRLPQGQQIAPATIPADYHVREATPEDYRAVCDVIDDAFREWHGLEPIEYADFAAMVYERPGFEPWNIRVAAGPDAAVIGAAQVSGNGSSAHVHRLAVAKDHRRRGLARALLVDAFGAGRAHGATTFELATDSRTGARTLYEKVGMRVTIEWVNYAIDL